MSPLAPRAVAAAVFVSSVTSASGTKGLQQKDQEAKEQMQAQYDRQLAVALSLLRRLTPPATAPARPSAHESPAGRLGARTSLLFAEVR
jgi:hypothetical protein